MKCPNCKKEIPAGVKVCGYCGKPLAVKKMTFTCQTCGADVPKKAKVCGECGTPLDQGRSTEIKTSPIKEQSKPSLINEPEPTNAPSKKGAKKWMLPVVIVFLVLMAAGLAWNFIIKPSPKADQPTQPGTAQKATSPFSLAEGNWAAIDTDGSTMSLHISKSANNLFYIVYKDEGASSCGYDSTGKSLLSYEGQGSGTTQSNHLIINDFLGKCEGMEQEFIDYYELIYNPTTDTLLDSEETRWHRK